MGRRWFASLVSLAVLAVAQPLSAQDEPRVEAYLRDTTRVESWSFLEPRPGAGDPNYTFFANRAVFGVRVSSRRFDIDAAVQYAQLLGLPARAIGPGALGGGAFYFFSAEAAEAYQLYIKTSMLRIKDVVPGVSIAVGRMSFSSGDETPSGDGAIDNVRRKRIASRLVGDFDWSIFQRSFDGGRVDIDRRSWSANASLLFPTQGGYEESANPTISSVKVLTASVTIKPALLPHQAVQLFAYHYRDQRDLSARPDNATFGSLRPNVSIATYGISNVAVVPVGSGELDAVVWLAAQTGDWYGQKHRAYSAAAEVGYRWHSPGRPWLRAGLVRASGDQDANDLEHHTFFQMLPSVRRYSMSTTYALMNVQDTFVQLSLDPHPRVVAHAEVHRLSLSEAADRWYYGSGATSRTGTFFGFASRSSGGATRLGTIAEGSIDVTLKRSWSMNGYLGWMKGADVVRRTFAGDRLVFFYLENVLSF
jgi:hypothetical protein